MYIIRIYVCVHIRKCGLHIWIWGLHRIFLYSCLRMCIHSYTLTRQHAHDNIQDVHLLGYSDIHTCMFQSAVVRVDSLWFVRDRCLYTRWQFYSREMYVSIRCSACGSLVLQCVIHACAHADNFIAGRNTEIYACIYDIYTQLARICAW